MSGDRGVPRPALVIRALEGSRIKDRPVLSPDRREAQLRQLERKGIRPPLEDRRG